MSNPLGEEFIRIRPDASGFRAELQAQLAGALGGVQSQTNAATSRLTKTAAGTTALGGASRQASVATKTLQRDIQQAETAAGRYTRGMFAATAASTGFFRAVSFASGAFLVGALAGGAIAQAVQEFADATRVGAQTAAVIKATGGAANVTAGQVDALAQRVLKLTGIDDELIKSSSNVLLTFRAIRNEVGQGNQIFDRATKAVADISSVFKTDLRGSAVQLGKALQDPVRGVTALRRSGITLTQSQRELIKRLVETGRILTAQKVILGEVEHQVGGTAAAIGRTLPGRLAILRESAKNSLGEYVKRVSESRQATELATQASQALGQTWGALRVTVQALGPPLLSVTQSLARTTQALGGAGNLLAAAAAYFAVTRAVKAATAAQALYARAALASVGASTLASRAAAATIAAQTGSVLAATRIRLATVALVGIRSVLTGPLGVAALIGGLTIGFLRMRRAAENAPGSLNATRRALDALSDSVARANRLQTQLAGRREDVSLGRFNVQAAEREVAQARARATRATPGSLEAAGLANRVTAAEEKLTEANRELARAERQRDIAESQFAANQRSRQFVIANTTRELQKQLALVGTTRTGGFLGLGGTLQAQSTAEALQSSLEVLDKIAKSGDPIKSKVGGALATLETVANRLATPRELQFIVSAIGRGLSQNAALALLEQLGQGRGIGGEAGTEQIRLRGLANAPTASAQLEQEFLGAKAVLAAERAKLKTLTEENQKRQQALTTQRESVRAAREAVQSARDARDAAVEGLQQAKRSLSDASATLLDVVRQAHQAVAQAIRDSAAAVNDAVQSAKSNLDSLGQSVAETLDKFFNAGGAAGQSGKLGATFKALRESIVPGGGGAETSRVKQQIEFALGAPKVPQTTDLSRQFADLTDALDRGKIKLPQFNRELKKLLAGVDLGEVQRRLGSAAANLLRDEIARLRQQAGLITRSPQRRGGGTAVDLVNPLQAVAAGAKAIAAARSQSAKDISGAQRDMADAAKGVTKAQRDVLRANQDLEQAQRRLVREQAKETKLNTAAVRANTRVMKQLIDVQKAKNRLEKPKPGGTAAAVSGDLAKAGAVLP